jgi:leucyl aminopeptidase
MPKHIIKVAATAPSFSKDTVFVVAITEKASKLTLVTDSVDISSIKSLDLAKLGAKAAADSIVKIPAPNGAYFAIVGGYKQDDIDSLRFLGGTIGRTLGDFRNIVVGVPTKTEDEAFALLEGYAIGNYSYVAYKSESKKPLAQTLTLATKTKVKPATLTRVEVLRSAVHDTRDLVSMPANDLYPQSFASAATKLAKGSAVTITILDEKKLAAGGFGGLLGVGKGSVRPPRLVKVEYKPTGAKKKIAFVGKGITYDTGGLSLKPANSMLGMKYDMTGAATVLNAVLAIARLKLKVQATAYLCLAENMPSGNATRPGDVIKLRNGKTVEVTNTDAEGRLVLGDGLALASESYPDLIVDVATLTGAQRIALGTRYAGLMGDDSAVAALHKATKEAGEFAWPMPFPEELRALLNSDIADLMNSRVGNPSGGMLVGGLFLKEFIGKRSKSSDELIPWVHLDLAGPADNDGAGYGFIPKGATGSYVRSLVALAESYAK